MKIAGEPIPLTDGTTVPVTISTGVACSLPWTPLSAAEFLAEADRYLYQAKAQGRNRVCGETSAAAMVSGEERAALFNQPEP
jgi:diguanylate cyclase (GGDEF)-like protein